MSANWAGWTGHRQGAAGGHPLRPAGCGGGGQRGPAFDEGGGGAEAPKIHELFIDIGAASRREAEKLVRVGDPITLADPLNFCATTWR